MSPQPTDAELSRAAEVVRRGGLVAFPTETVYGLGANALDPLAVTRIFEAKNRPWASPVIVHVADEAMARSLSAEWPTAAQKLARQYWPGPLTIVVRKARIVPDIVTANLDSVGLRMPDHPIAATLIRRAGVPIAAPSANRFGEISPTTAEHVRLSLGAAVDMILDGGPTQVGIESTVVSVRRTPPAVLRPGMIALEELERLTGEPWEREADLPEIVESPGQHPRHYAPKTPFFVLEPAEESPNGRGTVLRMPDDPREYAAELYARMHEADKQGWTWIAVRRPPDTPEWAGIQDRLRRASTPHRIAQNG